MDAINEGIALFKMRFVMAKESIDVMLQARGISDSGCTHAGFKKDVLRF